MFCTEFEDRLTDYLDGALEPEVNRAFAEHALRCPLCHEVLTEVKNTLQACRLASVPPPSHNLEAAILRETTPQVEMDCKSFEDHLTDYLDGFLPAPLYHRWERHAALCLQCTELPGEVVRSIGACYTYMADELPVPVGLNERILQATIGTVRAEEVRAPLGSRIASWVRGLIDPIFSPQLATVATMLLIAVFVLTNTVSPDGSIGGVYAAGLHLASRSTGANSDRDLKKLTDELGGTSKQEPAAPPPVSQPAEPEPQNEGQQSTPVTPDSGERRPEKSGT